MSEWLTNGAMNAEWRVVLAHGAGQGMDSPFMEFFASELAASGPPVGGVRVVRFEFPYMAARRADGRKRPPDREAVLLNSYCQQLERGELGEHPRNRIAIGGKSLGGRMASLVADETKVGGLICLGYPFHPPCKPDRLRTKHLETLTTRCCICQGERDPFGNRSEVDRFSLADSVGLHWMPDGDHGFKPRKASGFTEAENWARAVAAILAFLGTSRAG